MSVEEGSRWRNRTTGLVSTVTAERYNMRGVLVYDLTSPRGSTNPMNEDYLRKYYVEQDAIHDAWDYMETLDANQMAHQVSLIREQHEETRKRENEMGRREVIDSRMRELEAERARLESLPAEPPEWDSVVWFQKTFGGESWYVYAAVKVGDGQWWLTGKMNNRGPYDWDALLPFVQQGETAPLEVYVVATWEKLGDV